MADQNRARDIADQAVRLPARERETFVGAQCGNDGALQDSVLQILAQHDAAATGPVAHAGGMGGVAVDPALAALSVVGPYRILRQIGEGGMGQVFLATREDQAVRQHVAIKVVKRGFDTDDILRRFELERQILGALNHPNIARLYDAGRTTDGRPYLVMEYVEGETINEYCDRQKLDTTERVRLFQKVCSAVHAAHQNLIVHRDLKPTNVLVTQQGEPKLMDFGIAKLLNPAFSGILLAMRGDMRLMTPEYASPEQVTGSPIGTTSDVYSLGVMLYELLTGHRPYQITRHIEIELRRIICESEPEKPSTVVTRDEEIPRGDGTTSVVRSEDVARTRDGQVERLRKRLSGDLDNIILMAMRKEPRKRYDSAQALADDLARHLHNDPVTARPATWMYRADRFVRRNRGSVAAAGLIALIVLAAAVGMGILWRGERVAREAAVTANTNLENSRKKIAGFGRDLAERVRMLEGGTQSEKLAIDTSLEMIQGIASQLPDDAEWQAELAEALARKARLSGGMRGANLGETQAALDQIKRAVEVCRGLVKKEPENATRRASLARALIGLADVQRRSKASTEAVATYGEAIGILEKLPVSADEASVDSQRWLATVLLGRADVTLVGDKAGAAEADITRSMEIRKKLMNERPRDAVARREYTIGLTRVAELAEANNQLDKAISARREVLTIREQLEKEHSDKLTRRDRAVANEQLGAILSDPDRSLKHLDFAAAEYARLAEFDPEDQRNAWDLARVQNERGRVLLNAGRAEDSLKAYEQANARAAALLSLDSEDVSRQFELAMALEGVALAQDALGQDAKAKSSAIAAKKAFQNILAKNPELRQADREIELMDKLLAGR